MNILRGIWYAGAVAFGSACPYLIYRENKKQVTKFEEHKLTRSVSAPTLGDENANLIIKPTINVADPNVKKILKNFSYPGLPYK